MDSLPTWARAGQKVVSLIRFDAGICTKPIAEGAVLTIREVFSNMSGTGLRFVEVANPLTLTSDGEIERSYNISYFKPLISKTIEDDIAIFAPLLMTKNEKELVE